MNYIVRKRILRKLAAIFLGKNEVKVKSLLAKHHLSFIATNDSIISVTEEANVQMDYDNVHQITQYFFFDKIAKKNIGISHFIEDIGFYIELGHVQNILLDERYFKIEVTYGIEPFMVWINGKIHQVDSFGFVMNGILFIAFELIDYETGKPLTKDDVGIGGKNYNLLKVEKYQYFFDEYPEEVDHKISEIINEKINEFNCEMFNSTNKFGDCHFIHDTLVLSNDITNSSDYLCKLMGVKNQNTEIQDISTVPNYNYYPRDGCGLITNFDFAQLDSALYPAVILESLKIYIYMFQLKNLKDERDFNRMIKNDIDLKSLFCSPKLPIETCKMLDFIRESKFYKKNDEAMQLKVSYIKLQNDLKKNRNYTILNALLYVISLLGAISTLEVLEEHFGIPFKISFFVIIILFVLGIFYWIKEYKNNKSIS